MPTGWILRELNPADLKNHPVNAEIYGEPIVDDDMLASVKDFGILEPIRATKDSVVLSGHRRLLHAIKAKLKPVPVLVARTVLSDAEQVVEIVESNRQREKTREQLAREFGKLAEAKKALYDKKMRAGKKPDPREKFPEGSRAKDDAAKEVGMSRPTAEKALEVTGKIDEALAAGDTKKAVEIRNRLNTEPVARVHREVVAPLPIPEREAGDDEADPAHDAAPAEDGGKPNKKLDFDDKIIESLFGKLIKSVDDRARALKCMNGAYHKTCLNKLDAFIKSFKEWKATRR